MNPKWIKDLDNLNNIVYITFPQKHGNGGWCGDSVLLSTNLERALKLAPLDINNEYDYSEIENNDYDFYISTEPDSNKAIYKWSRYDCFWKKIK